MGHVDMLRTLGNLDQGGGGRYTTERSGVLRHCPGITSYKAEGNAIVRETTVEDQ